MLQLFTDFWQWMSPFKLSPQSSDPSTLSGIGQLYTKTTGGIVQLYFKQSDGTVIGPLGAAALESGTWTDNLAGTARLNNTVYQNTSGRKRRVAVTVSGDLDGQLDVQAYCDSANPPAKVIARGSVTVNAAAGGIRLHNMPLYFEVPSNWYYKVNNTNTTYPTWRELDE